MGHTELYDSNMNKTGYIDDDVWCDSNTKSS